MEWENYFELQKKLKVIFPSIHVDGEQKNKQMQKPDYRVKNKPVFFHKCSISIPNIMFLPRIKN